MGSWISATKTKIREIVSSVERQFPDMQLKLGFVAYRDFGDRPPFEVQDFTTDVGQFHQFLSRLGAYGGDDAAEDVLGGLEKVLTDMHWKSGIRVLVHFGDAPAHGHIYHNWGSAPSAKDKRPGDDDGTRGKELMKKLVYKRIDYYFAEISPDTQKMVGQLRRWYDQHETKQLAMQVFSLDSDVNSFLRRVVECVTTSIKSSSHT